ncbi:hypothetical protein V2G26_018486 [Clonostachys chloroleuca]|uniref:N-acetyltransferase domain-containing protein n=1 Tax=Clonostachys chloroleuca TaxID=1926264 RepID=A0AA35M0T2_9HYPO|nr:unnamed protein product [Clonostachys chloroleuca]
MPAIEAATLENVSSITDTFLACFNDEYFAELFPPTEVGVKYLNDAFSAFLEDESAGLFIIKDEQGNLASVLLFFEQPGGQPPRKWTTRWPAAREGMNGPMMEEFFLGMDGQHHQVMGDKQHTYVELVFTLPSQQRKGYGTQMVKYVAELVGATQPLYLDSRASTVKLYEQLGFVRQDCDIEGEMIPMVKPVSRVGSV